MKTSRINLDGSWGRTVDGTLIDFVQVPGVFRPLGECVLQREFDVSAPAEQGCRDFLCTEGVLASAHFEVNGHELGAAGPWVRTDLELPAGLLRELNSVTAKVRDLSEPFGPTPGRRFDAGLQRDIWIERRNAVFIEDFTFRYDLARDFSSAACTVALEVDGDGELTAEVSLSEAASGRVVATATASRDAPARFTIEWPRLWSPETPHLYELTITPHGEEGGERAEKVGFRRIEARGRDFYLNGDRLVLKGVCRHEFSEADGYSPAIADVRREMAMIKHAGFNYIRLVHSPHSRHVSRIAAEFGLLVSEEPGTCFHDLGDEAVAAPAIECLSRTVKRDRNVPSIFGWMIYNECNPHVGYAKRAAAVCRELDPGSLIGMADCSGRNDEVKEMVREADMSFYGINVYSFWPNDYCKRMEVFTDKPLVFTEWGGVLGQGNARVLKGLCDNFVVHAREDQPLRIAGSSFWAWADYEERSRSEPAAVDGYTIEGLVDRHGAAKPDLQILSTMCFDTDHPPVPPVPKVEILLAGPKRDEGWVPLSLGTVEGDQSALEQAVDRARHDQHRWDAHFITVTESAADPARVGRALIDGIEFVCRDVDAPAHPLMIGDGRAEVYVPVNRRIRGIAALGHVAFAGGYPSSTVQSVHHRDEEAPVQCGEDASEYEVISDEATECLPLRHGLEVLRSNDICRWWQTAPRAPHTRPAVRVVLSKTHEILRLDLWTHRFDAPRFVEGIRWRLKDARSIQMLYAMSVLAE